MKKQSLSLTIALMFGLQAFALPEASLGTRANGKILKIFAEQGYDTQKIQNILKHSGVPVLDSLWASKQDIVECVNVKRMEKCLVLSKFKGAPNGQPLVILPGFTGYRKMFLEYIYDMSQQGYGPIYISDFTGTGDSYKNYLKAGEAVPTLQERLKDSKFKKGVKPLREELARIAGPTGSPDALMMAISPLPVGIGWVKDFDDYQRDLNFIINLAANENSKKLVVTSLSMSGLVMAMGLSYQGEKPTWIKSVKRIVLESPMLRLHATDGALAGLITQIGSAAASMLFGDKTVVSPENSLPEFARKATGTYKEENVISHSPNRILLIDSLRTWNGAETASSTYGWVGQELKNQYAVKATDPKFSNLNSKMKLIAKALKENGVTLIAVVSNDDPLTDSNATKKFIDELGKRDVDEVFFCDMEDARHQIHAETDFYRNPFMELLYDQKSDKLDSVYGNSPADSAQLKCNRGGI